MSVILVGEISPPAAFRIKFQQRLSTPAILLRTISRTNHNNCLRGESRSRLHFSNVNCCKWAITL